MVSGDILLVVDYTKIKSEEKLLEEILEYLHDRLHLTRIRQLEVWRTKLEACTKIL